MSKYKIAIDLNEVIRDYLRQFLKTYQNGIDYTFDKEYDELDDFNLRNIFPFHQEGDDMFDEGLYTAFRYEDYAYELHCRAQLMERNLPTVLNGWVCNTLRNYGAEDGNDVEVVLMSPLEDGKTIPATYGFLNISGIMVRGITFPRISTEMWNTCDMIITANPNLIEAKPEGKVCVKINAPYNTETECELAFDSLCEMIQDPDGKVNSIIEEAVEDDE